MTYNLNGRVLRIKDKEIRLLMEVLEIPKEEAVQVYLCDHGYIKNEEQEALQKKAEELEEKVVSARSAEPAKKRSTSRKVDQDKKMLIDTIAEGLEGILGKVEVINETRLISIEYKEQKYEITLTKKKNK